VTQYWKEVVVKGSTFGSSTKRMERQCNQGYLYKFATKCLGRIKMSMSSQKMVIWTNM
jgi:hypothetical protein